MITTEKAMDTARSIVATITSHHGNPPDALPPVEGGFWVEEVVNVRSALGCEGLPVGSVERHLK